MPAVSQQQARYFGAIRGGAVPRPPGMTDKQVSDFASTSREGLPRYKSAKYDKK